jgi:iron complex outermembrane receptor protein
MRLTKVLCAGGAGAIGAVMAPAIVWAADAAGPAPAADSGAARLPEIVVTAQKRSERLQDVPIAITAVTSAKLDHSGVVTTVDLPTLVPGFVAQERTGSFVPFLRGVGSLDPNPENESIVSTYIDGVYIVNLYAGLMALNNVDRIEVLKGPQGTLFGRNSVGGVINIVTKTPSSAPHGDLQVGYGAYDTFTAKAYLTGPLAPNLSADFALAYQNQGKGWGTDIANGSKVGYLDYLGLRSKVYLDLPRTQVTLALDYGTTDADSSVDFSPYTSGQILPFHGGPFTGGFYDDNNIYPAFMHTRQEGVSLKVRQDLGFARLTSLSSYRYTTSNRATNQLNGLAGTEHTSSNDYTQELQLSADDQSKVKWIVGVFYLNHSIDPTDHATFSAPPVSPVTDRDYGYTTQSVAGYAQATVPLGFSTNVTGGIRYNSDDQGFFRKDYHDGTLLVAFPSAAFPSTSKTFNQWTWRAAVDHKFTDDIMAYVSYNRGYKAGVWNALLATPNTTNPEILDAYELGLKSEFWEHRLRVDAATFYYDYQNIQYNVILPQGIFLLQNAASAKISGLDLDTSLLPAPHLQFTAGAEFLWRRNYSSFPTGVVFIPSGSVVNGHTVSCGTPNCLFSGSFEGNVILLAPAFSGNIGVDYTIPMQTGDVNLNITASYISKIYRTIDDRLTEPGYPLLNASVRWTPGNKGVTITAWGKNLNGVQYHSFGAALNFGYVGAPAAPRTFGATVAYKF